ncbi:hypothetical protein RJ639_004947 [Escallonia herrerae]|uniref:J domain-containing protein n=1 Tax=Escallonia herrerae TaxID=1293975 RepID=A0AA89AWZ6_9ASTE|nr:hypothetical protein RJ639_004947 [Escallonia herrerae]
MARKGNQHRNGLDRQSSNHKKVVSESGSPLTNTKGRANESEPKLVTEEGLPSGNKPGIHLTESANKNTYGGDEKKSKQKSGKFPRREKQGVSDTQGRPVPCVSSVGDCIGNSSPTEVSGWRGENGTSADSNLRPDNQNSSSGHLPNGLHTNAENIELPDSVIVRRLRTLALSILEASTEWLERKKPLFITVTNNARNARDYVRMKIQHGYPIVLRWTMQFVNIMLLLLLVWLDCSLRGIDSLLRMGTTSFLAVIWCSVFSVVAMIGIFKFFIILAIGALTGLLVGLTFAIVLFAISGIVLLWLYGSFWTAALVIFLGGLAFMFRHERVAMFITTVYSLYCAWAYVGWLGLLMGLNLSFISSDALVFFLRNNTSDRRRPDGAPEQTAGVQGEPGIFSGEQWHASFYENVSRLAADRNPGVPSTSGSDSDLTSEDEVVRLLNCTDHYSALGFSRFGEVDVSLLKREYRKKAMLVHPDKNMGNEKAAEAFKKLQNAYEVFLDSSKRKAYDDELKREELLKYFLRFQNASQKTRGNGFFGSTFACAEGDPEDPQAESRRIACRKCSDLHVWFHTKKSKARARWCQDCKDFHQAKDGDGWVEQSSQPFLFGILQKVDAPRAYVCADSKIYDATQWYICQGMRCPVNTHKPSFHVNTSVTAKHNSEKGPSSAQRGSGMPTSNMEETMTEEEFVEWLQNAVQSGMFDNFSGDTSDNPSARAGSSFKTGGSSSSGGKKKKKGKKQW